MFRKNYFLMNYNPMVFRMSSVYTVRSGNRCIHIASSIEQMREFRRSHQYVSFIPTMGALHDGHLTLVQKAKSLGHKVVVSIFVNPMQFSAGEDLDKYPRQLEADLNKLRPLGVDCVFTPAQTEMYPNESLCHVEPTKFSMISEGQSRPDFFRGVATVVNKLFNIVQPTHSFFGQKDISQCILIQRMVNDLNMPVCVKICPTVREVDGLAMSSRNTYLSPSERPACSVLYKALSQAKDLCDDSAARNASLKREEIVEVVNAVLRAEPLVTKIEYISIASHVDMMELSDYCGGSGKSGAVISAAIRVGNVRLIDNVLVGQAIKDILGAD